MPEFLLPVEEQGFQDRSVSLRVWPHIYLEPFQKGRNCYLLIVRCEGAKKDSNVAKLLPTLSLLLPGSILPDLFHMYPPLGLFLLLIYVIY